MVANALDFRSKLTKRNRFNVFTQCSKCTRSVTNSCFSVRRTDFYYVDHLDPILRQLPEMWHDLPSESVVTEALDDEQHNTRAFLLLLICILGPLTQPGISACNIPIIGQSIQEKTDMSALCHWFLPITC